jgi:hypothetical protein
MNCLKTRNRNLCFLCSVLFIILSFTQARSQAHVSLFGWNEKTQQIVLNQYQNFGGPFYDRGLFRIYTPAMSMEHDIDLVTYDFSVFDEYSWHHNEQNSFRTYVGSFDLGEFLHGMSLRNYIPLAPGLTFPLHIDRRFDMRTDRTVIWLGLDYAFTQFHSAGIRQSVSEQKADLNAMLYYRYGSAQAGWVQAEITFLDWANNAIYGLGEQRGTAYVNSRKHERFPVLFSFRAASPVWNQLRGELMGGLLTRSRSKVGPIDEDELNTLDRSRAHWFGALGEWAGPHITVALTWQTRYANFRRENYLDFSDLPGEDAEEIRYGNFQWENTLGGITSFRYGRLQLQNYLRHIWIRDRERDVNQRPSQWYSDILFTPFDYRERRWVMRHRLSWIPVRDGFSASLEWSSMYHDMDSDYTYEHNGRPVRAFDYRQLHTIASVNERLTLILGYHFKNRSRIEIGASYDVDGDREQGYYDYMVDRPPRRFDGGFGRVTIFW